MHCRGIDDMNRTIIRRLGLLPDGVDLVVGIPRSGLLAASMISLYLNVPMTELDGLAERRLIGRGKRALPNHDPAVFDRARRILVVDDCVSQGSELMRARRIVERCGLSDKTTFAAVYGFPDRPRGAADLVMEQVPRPMCFLWSCLHAPGLERKCVDIDGILCVNPTSRQDDDGPRYRRFLSQARPLMLPTARVGWLVTCRLEKYRALTEDWLRRHGVVYDHLVMLDLPDLATRRRARIDAEFKAGVYRESGADLFIESCPGLARRIADLSGRPVVCFETATVMGLPASQRIDMIAQRMQYWARRLRRAPRKAARMLLPGGGGWARKDA